MIENAIKAIIDFLTSNEFTAIAATALMIIEMFRIPIKKLANAWVNAKLKKQNEQVKDKENIINEQKKQIVEITKLFNDAIGMIQVMKTNFDNLTEAQKVAFNNSNLKADAKIEIEKILNKTAEIAPVIKDEIKESEELSTQIIPETQNLPQKHVRRFVE